MNLYFLFCLFRLLAPYVTDSWTMDELNNLPIQNSYLYTAVLEILYIWIYISKHTIYNYIYVLEVTRTTKGRLVVLVVVLIMINLLVDLPGRPDDLKLEKLERRNARKVGISTTARNYYYMHIKEIPVQRHIETWHVNANRVSFWSLRQTNFIVIAALKPKTYKT
jgi:hypothetical protein